MKALEDQLLNFNSALDGLHEMLDESVLAFSLAKEVAVHVAKMEGMPAATFENYRV